MKRGLYILMLVSVIVTGAYGQAKTTRRPAGIGPFLVETTQEKMQARLLRREDNTVWVLRKSTTGQGIQAGLFLDDIVHVEVPRPKMLEQAELYEEPDQAAEAARRLVTLGDRLKAFRALPGMIADESYVTAADLWMQAGEPAKAQALYDEVMTRGGSDEWRQYAQVQSGLGALDAGNITQALERLDVALVADAEPARICQVYHARGRALLAQEQWDDAVLHLLYPAVFYPHVGRSEPSGIQEALAGLAALQDWNSVRRMLAVLAEDYPGSREYRQAVEQLDPWREQINAEELFEITEPSKEEEEYHVL